MSKKVYENARVFVEGYRVGRFSNTISIDIEAEEGDGKTFYSEGWNETTRGGRSITVAYEGYILTQDDPYRMEQDLNGTDVKGMVVAPDGDVVGTDALLVTGRNTGAGYEYNTDDTGSLSVDFGGSGKPKIGNVILVDTFLDDDHESDSFDLGIGGAAKGVTLAINVMDPDGAPFEIEITLEDSADDSAFASVDSIIAEDRGCYILRVTDPVDRYVRLNIELGGDTDSAAVHASIYQN